MPRDKTEDSVQCADGASPCREVREVRVAVGGKPARCRLGELRRQQGKVGVVPRRGKVG